MPALNVVLAVVLCGGVFVLLAWVWARALEERRPKPRRRGVGRGQLIALPLVLILASVTSWSRLGDTDDPLLVALRVTPVVVLILALVLVDQDLRRRADDPLTRHRLTSSGVAAIAAVLVALGATTAEAAVVTGDPGIALAAPATLVALAGIAALDFALALAIRSHRRRRRSPVPREDS